MNKTIVSCEQSFSQCNRLKVHMMILTGEMPFACTVCAQCFVKSANLKTLLVQVYLFLFLSLSLLLSFLVIVFAL